jgi:NTE family protein
MFRVFLVLLLALVAYADERPKIGLVLSGGGARGGAHLGVIKAFERHRIPIDAIAGTSMGAFVGGLYASGKSTAEIETLLTTTRWNEVIALDYDRREIPFRRKELQRTFPGKVKVGIDAADKIVIGTGLFKRQIMLQFLEKETYGVSDITDFDDLAIPFRAVASNLENGEAVVLRSGSLAKSIYASLAIPGGFEPITIGDKTLVDGGMADNLPLDVMRNELDVDLVIVVDISTPFPEKTKFVSYIDVMGQLSAILTRKNVEETIDSMRPGEILLTPELDGISPLDADRYPEIIEIGEATVEALYARELAQLSLTESEYARYRDKSRRTHRFSPPMIDRIVLRNSTDLNDEAILAHLHSKTGEPLDFGQLQKDLAAIYNLMLFEDVDYSVQNENGLTTLYIRTTPAWDVNGQLRFALGFEDNFDGHSDYTVKFEYLMFGLNSYGGEWRNRLSIGREQLLMSEWYQPLDVLQRFYFKPSLFYRDQKVYLSPTIMGVEAELDDSIPIRVKDYGGSAGLGVNVTNDAQMEAGATIRSVNPSVNVIQVSGGSAELIDVSPEQRSRQLYARLAADALDDAHFPTQGYAAEARYTKEMEEWGSDNRYTQFYARGAAAYSLGRHTFLPRVSFGTTGDSEAFARSQDFSAFYTLGGLFSLSGLPTNAVSGDHMVFGSLIYRYTMRGNGFFGALTVPLYAGMSIEAGETWYESYGQEYQNKALISAGSIYVAADTVLGPLYFAAGSADGRYYSLYLSLGNSF